jgi:biopolymer transport protein ExbD
VKPSVCEAEGRQAAQRSRPTEGKRGEEPTPKGKRPKNQLLLENFMKRQSFGLGKTETGTFRPQLTSLVDVMAIILVFLIKTFSTEGNIVTPSSDLKLPVSTSVKKPSPHWSIEIARNAVMSEGAFVASTGTYAKQDSLLIPALLKWLEEKRRLRGDTSSQALIQCDREVPYSIVKKVMYTCSKAKFTDFSVLVIQEE